MHNPLMTQRYSADPWVLVHNDTVYVYTTGDVHEFDGSGEIKENSYATIHRLNVISSKDLVNWTDWGQVDVRHEGVTAWARNSWAPAAAAVERDGKTRFYLYFANNASSIGVLVSDSPTGPFTDPIGKPLVTRDTPNCRDVVWMFDPAVLVDDDGRAWLYFGGGVPNGKAANPNTARVVELGPDMTSLAGIPVTIDAPYLFEDSGINKIGSTYYYSYCTNWQVPPEEQQKRGMASGQIAYMTSDRPDGPFTYAGVFFRNPGVYFGDWGNNHHHLFQFRDDWYLAYHSRLLENRKGVLKGYRSAHLDHAEVGTDGKIKHVTGSARGVDQSGYFDPYALFPAATFASQAGLDTIGATSESLFWGTGERAITSIDAGDWLYVEGADFGEKGASGLRATVRLQKSVTGGFSVYAEDMDGEPVARVQLDGIAPSGKPVDIRVDLDAQLVGVKNIYILFTGGGFTLTNWQFD